MSAEGSVKPDYAHEQCHDSDEYQLMDDGISVSTPKDDVDSFTATSATQNSSPIFEKLCKHRECNGRGSCTYDSKCDHVACRNRRECRQSGEDAAQSGTGKPSCGHGDCQNLESCLLLETLRQTKRCKHGECQQMGSCHYNAKCAHGGCINRRECKEAKDTLAPGVPLHSCSHGGCRGLTACLRESSTFQPDAPCTRHTQDHLEDQGDELDTLAQMTTDQQAVEAAEDSRDQGMGEHREEHVLGSGAEHDAYLAIDDSDEGRPTRRKKPSKSQDDDSESDSEPGSNVESSDEISGEESDSDDDFTKHHASHGKNVHFDEAHNKHHSHPESDASDPTDTESGDESSGGRVERRLGLRFGRRYRQSSRVAYKGSG